MEVHHYRKTTTCHQPVPYRPLLKFIFLWENKNSLENCGSQTSLYLCFFRFLPFVLVLNFGPISFLEFELCINTYFNALMFTYVVHIIIVSLVISFVFELEVDMNLADWEAGIMVDWELVFPA
ncbi:hypothetical protein ACJX0J_026862 [Zea mays]